MSGYRQPIPDRRSPLPGSNGSLPSYKEVALPDELSGRDVLGAIRTHTAQRLMLVPPAGLGYEDIRAAVRCRSGPPALRGRGRSRARRRGCPPWIRTTTARAQNAVSCQLDQRALVREAGLAPARRGVWAREVCLPSLPRAPPGTRTPFSWIKSPVLHPYSSRRAERHAGLEPAFPAWRAGTLAVVLMPHRGSPRTRTPCLLSFGQPLYPMS
jgi:hypothetical protein